MLNYWQNVLLNQRIKEQECQHQISIENKDLQSDYTVLDVEYEVSQYSLFHYKGKRKTKNGNTPTPRFDIIAIRNSDHRLCVIELKKGIKAFGGQSGIQEHAESYKQSIGYNNMTQQHFKDEMQGIINIKKEMNLIDKNLYIDSSKDIEFIFAYQYDETDKKKDFAKQKSIFEGYQNETNYTDGKNYAKGKKVIWLPYNSFSLKD